MAERFGPGCCLYSRLVRDAVFQQMASTPCEAKAPARTVRPKDGYIRLNPDYVNLQASLFNNRGAARRDKGDLDGATEDFTEAIRLEPDDAVAFVGRSTVRRKRGDLDGAIQDCNEAIRIKPEALFFDNRGKARFGKGDLDGAIQDYTEAIRLKPDKPIDEAIIFENRSEALRKKGDFGAAEQDHNRAIELGYVAPGAGRE